MKASPCSIRASDAILSKLFPDGSVHPTVLVEEIAGIIEEQIEDALNAGAARYSAQYILEEIRESGEQGINTLANATGYSEGVIAAALDNIFKGVEK